MTVRVRIGPSPTGEPHVGTAYMALFNLAVARKHGGKFVLRVEDTDQTRSHPEWERQIIEGLKWLGLEWDEGPDKGGDFGPYRQSERTDIYREHVDKLLDNGSAYRCFCTPERLDALRKEQREKGVTTRYDGHCRDLSADDVEAKMTAGEPYVVRLRIPEGKTVWKDELRDEIEIDNQVMLDDQVLLKSDGFPTYHLANVVDDHLMEITHVIRAEEWINSTPKHLLLYRAFGWAPPKFHHMPLLRNPGGSKISKRKNPVSILDYKQRGFLPEAVNNYLAMMGWTMPDGREMFSVEEFVEAFTWDRLSLGGPVFDLTKLTWLNGKYYREKLSDEQLKENIKARLCDDALLSRIVPLIKERIDTAEQFISATEYFFSGDVEVDPAMMKHKKWKGTNKELRVLLETYADALDKQIDFSADALEAMSRAFAEEKGVNAGVLSMPTRAALTGRKATPPLFDTMSVLGRAQARRRLRHGIEVLKKAKS